MLAICSSISCFEAFASKKGVHEAFEQERAVEAFWDLLKEDGKEFEDSNYLLKNSEVINRFGGDVFCPRETAVSVELENKETTFLHANFVKMLKGCSYIAAQAPLSGLLETEFRPVETRDLFWKAVSENAKLIVDLTRSADKIIPYCPEAEGQSESFGEVISVKCIGVDKVSISDNEASNIYTLKLTDLVSGKTKKVKRLHFSSWADFSGTATSNLKNLVSQVNQLCSEFSEEEATLVHCRAGVGRTGTLIVARSLEKLIREGKIKTRDELHEQIYELIILGRKQRGALFVQQPTQLCTIIRYGYSLLAGK